MVIKYVEDIVSRQLLGGWKVLYNKWVQEDWNVGSIDQYIIKNMHLVVDWSMNITYIYNRFTCILLNDKNVVYKKLEEEDWNVVCLICQLSKRCIVSSIDEYYFRSK